MANPSSLLLLKLPPLPADLILPPLPPITDTQLERLVFTHSSYHGRPRKATSLEYEIGEEVEDNEKLEHVGDAWLGESLR
jgi:dsRNA-specific ribonuclease